MPESNPPPKTPHLERPTERPTTPSVVSPIISPIISRVVSLKGEAEFRRILSGETHRTPFFTLRRLPYRPLFGKPWQPSAVVGIVASKKSVGNAVKRNRARRRVREALRLVAPNPCRAILLLNPAVLTAPFADLKAALELAFARPIKPAKAKSPPSKSPQSKNSQAQSQPQAKTKAQAPKK
jgi:ribonuclease P protein component